MEDLIPETTLERRMLQHASANRRPATGCLELSPLCNMNCKMCYVRLSRRKQEQHGRLRTAAEWLELGRQMQNGGVLFLLLTGGEPLLFPGFRELFSGLRSLGMILTVNTNGTLINEKWADFFAEHMPRRINITLYGSNERTYASLCHYPGGFGKTLRGIRLLLERGVQVKINGSATRSNQKDLDAIYRIGDTLGVPVAIDTYMLPGLRERGLPFSDQARLAPEQAAQAQWKVICHDTPPNLLQEYMKQTLAKTEASEACQYPDCVTCMAGRCSFAVDWQGRMRPCVTLEEPAVPVFETDFEAAWETISREVKRFHIHPKCTTCRLRPLCPNCAGSAKLETGAYDGIPDYLCRYSEELYRIIKQEASAILK